MLKAIEMLKNYADVEIFIASILIFINFAPLKPSKRQTKKTIDMKKTLLSALKHGSGILLTLFSLLLSCQVWATRTFSDGECVYLVNFKPSGWDDAWIRGSGKAWIELWNDPGDHITYDFSYTAGTANSVRSTYTATITGGGEYTYYKIYRGKSDGSETWNSTGTISFSSDDAGKNTITYFVKDGTTATWVASRSFSSGEFIYLKNIVPGGWSSNWINTSDATIAYLYTWGGTAGVHTYKFNLVSGTGEAGATNSIYGAQFSSAGTYAGFILTRGGVEYDDGEWPETNKGVTNDVVYDASKNYLISYTTSSSVVTWDVYCNNPTVTAGAYSSLTSSSVTIAATVAAAASIPCEISNVGVEVYLDQACSSSTGVYKEVEFAGSEYSITGVNVSSLSPNVTYYYKTYAKRSYDDAKVYSSNVRSFVMPCLSGVATTNPSTSTQTVCLGSATALSVTASGPGSGYTYQWYYNSSEDKSGATPIPGATSASYTPAVVGENYYYCSVGAAGGYCDVDSNFSGKITIKGVPVVSASASSVTNYVPVTLTATGVESTNWSITSGAGGYLYDTNATTVKFKGNVGSLGPVTYTIQATSNGCSGTANVTVSRNSDNCQ